MLKHSFENTNVLQKTRNALFVQDQSISFVKLLKLLHCSCNKKKAMKFADEILNLLSNLITF